VGRAEAEAILDGEREMAVALLLRIGELVEANGRLGARVAELERRLKRSSRSPSLPPSQDPPSAPPRPRRPGWGGKRGGQPGHEGSHRQLLAPQRVDEVVEHWPERCRSCAHVFTERELVDAAQPWRHQTAGLPAIAVRVSEHRLHGVCCPRCATRTGAGLLGEVPRSSFVSRLRAAVVTLAARKPRLSPRRDRARPRAVRRRALHRFGRRDRAAHRGGARRAPYKARAGDQVGAGGQHRRDRLEDRRRQPDALGRPDRRTAVFGVAAGRHGFEARTLLGERYGGIVCSDRWRGYDYLDPERRQLCWAHLLRDFTAHGEGMAEQKRFGSDGLQIARELFAAWDSYQAFDVTGRLLAADVWHRQDAGRCDTCPLPEAIRATSLSESFR
jgi:transposase